MQQASNLYLHVLSLSTTVALTSKLLCLPTGSPNDSTGAEKLGLYKYYCISVGTYSSLAADGL